MPPKAVTIFAIDDDDVDTMMIERSLKEQKISNPLIRAVDGYDAFRKLKNGDIPQPYIILLDLNMPRMSGHEFLNKIRNDDDLKTSVVFVLTTSKAEEDRWKAYEKNIAGYIVKSRAGEDFLGAINLLKAYWKIVELP